jgi:hypothetical protein
MIFGDPPDGCPETGGQGVGVVVADGLAMALGSMDDLADCDKLPAAVAIVPPAAAGVVAEATAAGGEPTLTPATNVRHKIHAATALASALRTSLPPLNIARSQANGSEGIRVVRALTGANVTMSAKEALGAWDHKLTTD